MLELQSICVRQEDFSLDDISFTIPAGAYAVMMGKTGTGKTTLLELIAGLRSPTAGIVRINGQDVTHLAPAARNLGYVPQDAVLFPTMSVEENIGFALKARRLGKDIISTRVRELAVVLGLSQLLKRRPVGLSGGESRRVALGRALAARPPLLLLDEPLSGLDDETREELIVLLREISSSHQSTVLHVTHSRSEAESLADVRLGLGGGMISVLN